MNGPRLWALWGLSALALPALAAPAWNVARSDHFEVWSDAPADNARALDSGLEQLRTFFVRHLGIVPRDRVKVICFGSAAEYDDYRIRPGADGFALTGPGGQYIVTHAGGPADLRIPAHEYAHLLIQASGWTLPEWLAEGISDVVSGVRFGERYTLIGGDFPGRSQSLKAGAWMGPAELFAISLKGDPDFAREPLFYSESWAVAEMLIVSPAYAPRFPALVAMLSRGSSSEAAIEGVYGISAGALFREARERLTRGPVPLPLPAVAEGPRGRLEAASWFDAQVVLAGLRHAAGQTSRAEAAYRELAAERPGAPEIPAALGLLALENRDAAGAVREWGLALSLGVRDADLCYRYAALADERGLDPAQVRAALQRAIELRPGFDEARFRLGLMEQNASHPGEALAQFRAMRAPAPEQAWRYYSALADALLDPNRREEAREAALQAERAATNDAEREHARTAVYLAETEMTVQIAATPDGRRVFRTVRVPVNAPPRNPFIEAGDDARSAEATLDEVECADDGIRLLVATGSGPLRLAIADPSRVQIRNGGGVKFEFTCGAQEKRRVLVEYTAGKILRGLELR